MEHKYSQSQAHTRTHTSLEFVLSSTCMRIKIYKNDFWNNSSSRDRIVFCLHYIWVHWVSISVFADRTYHAHICYIVGKYADNNWGSGVSSWTLRNSKQYYRNYPIVLQWNLKTVTNIKYICKQKCYHFRHF